MVDLELNTGSPPKKELVVSTFFSIPSFPIKHQYVAGICRGHETRSGAGPQDSLFTLGGVGPREPNTP